MIALLVLAILVGGALQRVTGMGFGLVAGPFIVLIMGPFSGVLLVNLAGAVASLLILGRVLRGVDWRRYAWLATASVVVAVPAATAMRGASSAGLEITVGAVVIAAMTTAVVTQRLRRARGGSAGGAPGTMPDTTAARPARWPLLVTGAASGFGSVAAGTGGPPLAVYAVLSGWEAKAFAATAQPFFATNAAVALVAKLTVGGLALPALGFGGWAVVAGSLVGGLLVGEWIAPKVSADATRHVLVVLAYVGGAATLLRGLTELL